MNAINTHGMICDFGRHQGTPYTRLPVSYLKWMVGARHSRADVAEAELDRRGTTTPVLDISGHAIDRASLSCRKIWHETRSKDEGLHSWLCRMASEALAEGAPDEDGRCFYNGMKMVFEDDTVWPILKTVMPQKRKETK